MWLEDIESQKQDTQSRDYQTIQTSNPKVRCKNDEADEAENFSANYGKFIRCKEAKNICKKIWF